MATAILSPTATPHIATTRSRSSLNPNAPTFVPLAFLQAEDFSPQWWYLIHTCPAFRDHWLQEYCSIEADLLRQHDDVSDFAGLEHVSLELKQDLENVPFLSSDAKLDLDFLVIKQRKQQEVKAYGPSKPLMPPKTVLRPQKSSLRKIIQQPR